MESIEKMKNIQKKWVKLEYKILKRIEDHINYFTSSVI